MKTNEEIARIVIESLGSLISEASALPLPEVATQSAAMEYFQNLARETAVSAIRTHLAFHIAAKFVPNEGS